MKSDSSPIISVIIPCFNAGAWIREALESVLVQDIGDIEIIVVDDGSTDDSALIVEREFPSVCLIRTQHQGSGKVRNLGTKLSKGKFIQYLDADDLLVPGKLKIQLEILQKSSADVAYGDWQKLEKNKDGAYIEGEKVRRQLNNPEIDLFTDFWCPPAVYLFRRSIVEKIGGWNEELYVVEDARFVQDCALHKARFVYCENIMAYYRRHPKQFSIQDPISVNRAVFKNACEIEKWWLDHGGISDDRLKALIKVYGYVARASFEKDKKTFEAAYQNLERLRPGYIPEGPWHLRLASILLGYRRAEALALLFRQVKKINYENLRLWK